MRFFAAFILLASSVGAFAQIQVPKALSSPDPIYPAEAAEMGLGGSVRVHVKVDKQGNVSPGEAFGPVASCSNLYDKRAGKIRESAIAAAKNARFEPLAKDGKPVSYELALTFHFDNEGKPLRRPKDGEVVETGVLKGRIKYLAPPEYPLSAKANRIAGAVPVSVLIDTNGKIIAAAAIGGHPQLSHNATLAACKSSVEPTILKGTPVQVRGVIVYNFLP